MRSSKGSSRPCDYCTSTVASTGGNVPPLADTVKVGANGGAIVTVCLRFLYMVHSIASLPLLAGAQTVMSAREAFLWISTRSTLLQAMLMVRSTDRGEPAVIRAGASICTTGRIFDVRESRMSRQAVLLTREKTTIPNRTDFMTPPGFSGKKILQDARPTTHAQRRQLLFF